MQLGVDLRIRANNQAAAGEANHAIDLAVHVELFRTGDLTFQLDGLSNDRAAF